MNLRQYFTHLFSELSVNKIQQSGIEHSEDETNVASLVKTKTVVNGIPCVKPIPVESGDKLVRSLTTDDFLFRLEYFSVPKLAIKRLAFRGFGTLLNSLV